MIQAEFCQNKTLALVTLKNAHKFKINISSIFELTNNNDVCVFHLNAVLKSSCEHPESLLEKNVFTPMSCFIFLQPLDLFPTNLFLQQDSEYC